MRKRTIGMLSDVDVNNIGCAALVAAELKTAQDFSLKVAEQMKVFEEVLAVDYVALVSSMQELTIAVAVTPQQNLLENWCSRLSELSKDLVTERPRPLPGTFSSRFLRSS